jgi:hypothetical protein
MTGANPVDMFNVSDHHAREALLTRLDLRDAPRIGATGHRPQPSLPVQPGAGVAGAGPQPGIHRPGRHHRGPA